MKKNIGKTDKTIRIVVGALLLLGGIYWGSWIAGILGVLVLTTALVGWCCLYRIFGINTNCKCEGGVCTCGSEPAKNPTDTANTPQ